MAEIWLTYNQAVHLIPLEVLVLCSSADCSAKDAKRTILLLKFSFVMNEKIKKNPHSQVSQLVS